MSQRSTQDAAPGVSIIVIAFNELHHGPTCVRSILAQETKASFELVFVDDGSTDGTAEAVTAAAAGDERFRLVRLRVNRGRGAARAAGVQAAQAPVIAFVDADITLPQDWLQRCLDELPGYAAVSGIAVPDGDTTVLARVTGATPREVPGSTLITGNNVLFAGGVLAEIGFDPRDRLGEDVRLANRLVRAGHRLKRVPGLTVRHEEGKSYARAIRWRFESGVDASSLARELGRLRFADLVWLGWLAAWVLGLALAAGAAPAWVLLGPAATVGAGVAHAISRFSPRPLGPFLLACMADVPLLAAYLAGRTVGLPRFVLGRR